MQRLLVIVLFLFISCKNANNSIPKNHKNAWFDEDLNSKLLDYQKLFPIPNDKKEKGRGLYVYVVSFYKINADTFVTIKRAADGISIYNWDMILGVYQDDQLLPTFIRDSSSFYSRNFIHKIVIDSLSLKQFQPNKGEDYPESFPPVYEYTVENNKLSLTKIDTVWYEW